MREMIYLKHVVTLSLDEEKCVGCGMCMTVCPHAVFGMNERHAKITNIDACMECGACAMNCPADAIRVNSGAGCATAVINTALGRDSADCCCMIVDSDESQCTKKSKTINCC